MAEEPENPSLQNCEEDEDDEENHDAILLMLFPACRRAVQCMEDGEELHLMLRRDPGGENSMGWHWKRDSTEDET